MAPAAEDTPVTDIVPPAAESALSVEEALVADVAPAAAEDAQVASEDSPAAD